MAEINVYNISNSGSPWSRLGGWIKNSPTTSGSSNTDPSGVGSSEDEEGRIWFLARLFNKNILGEAEGKTYHCQGVADLQNAEAESLPDRYEPIKQSEGVLEVTGEEL